MRELYRSPADADRIQSWCRERLDAWPVRHDTEHLDTSLGRTHLTWAGTAREAVCLYLPGTNFNAATSTTLLTSLASRWRVVCADLPGQPGLSAAGAASRRGRGLRTMAGRGAGTRPATTPAAASRRRRSLPRSRRSPAGEPSGRRRARAGQPRGPRQGPADPRPAVAEHRLAAAADPRTLTATRRPDGGRQRRGTRSARRVADVGRNVYPDHRCPRPTPSRTAGSMAGPERSA